jgi:hypothetical protein
MYAQRLLQINVAALVVLGAILLGMGQRSPGLPLGVLTAAVASIVLTDVTGWFKLNKLVTNLAAAAALGLAVWHLYRMQGLEQVLAFANLLVYLQIILLFQEKRPRTYQQLALLSLLEVIVVAALFDHGFFFGLMLVVYLFVGLSALALLSLHRDRVRHGPPAGGAEPPRGDKNRAASGPAPAFTSLAPALGERDGLGRELWARLVRIALGTLVLTLVVFLTLPRFGQGAWRGVPTRTRRAVGFDDRVQLGDLGSVIEDPTEVLRAEFFKPGTNEPHQVRGSIYLRGALLNHYDRGEWRFYWRADPEGKRHAYVPKAEDPPPEGLIVQRYTIEPLDRRELFAIWPIEGVNTFYDRRMDMDNYRRRLVRDEEWRRQRMTYRLGTTAVEQGWQEEVVPCAPDEVRPFLLQMPPSEGPDAVPALVALADEWVGESAETPDDPYGCAKLLERNLRDSGQFEYTLEGIGGLRDPAIDPIEDFITQHPRGHCEYFATALVLMLRSQGIPARLAVGYRTDEWNDVGRFYQARQLHAHTWVEVYLEPDEIPAEVVRIGDRGQWARGAWLRLDPTPAAADEGRLGAVGAALRRFDDYLTWLDYVWDNYVMEMDSPRQREAIYEPAAEWVQAAVRKVRDPAWWRQQFQSLGETLRGAWEGLIEGKWFNWKGGLAAVAVLLGLAAVYRAVAAVVRRLRRRAAGRPGAAAAAARAHVEFYRRLESLLARRGLKRHLAETQREFAKLAGDRIARATGDPGMAALPVTVAEAFYRVRFGGRPLAETERADVEAALARLSDAVASGEWRTMNAE